MYDFQSIRQAGSLKDACEYLHQNPETLVIAGGTDILIKIRNGKLKNCSLLSIHGLDALKGIYLDDDENMIIGSGEIFSDITGHPLIKKYVPMLGLAADQVGGPQIRNMGTIGGNICNGVTSADTASSLMAMDAELAVQGIAGLRTLPIEKFYLGAGKVDLRPGEILTSIKIYKDNYQGFHGHYVKYAMRNAMDIATLGCAVWLKPDVSGRCIDDIRIAYGVAGPVPVRCKKTETAIKGMVFDDGLLERFSELIIQDVNPRTSWRASREFRLHLVKEVGRRALKEAFTGWRCIA